MMDFNDLLTKQNQGRSTQRDLLPSVVHNRQFSNNMILSTTVFQSSGASVPNGSSLVVQSIITSATNSNVTLASVPFCIVFFEGSVSTTTMIPGVAADSTSYKLNGPVAIPTFLPYATNSPLVRGGSNGNNLVYLTELVNNTGGTQTIYYITNTRFIQAQGAGGSNS